MAGRYVRVLFDLDYKTHEGDPVSIKQGDKCLLLKKSNADWWSVVKEGDKKPIYVPANYVEEILPPTSPKPKFFNKEGAVKKHVTVVAVGADKENKGKPEDNKKEEEKKEEEKKEERKREPEKNARQDSKESDGDAAEYVNVQELGILPPGVSAAQDKGDKPPPTVDTPHEPVEYANLEAIQQAIQSKSVNVSILFLRFAVPECNTCSRLCTHIFLA